MQVTDGNIYYNCELTIKIAYLTPTVPEDLIPDATLEVTINTVTITCNEGSEFPDSSTVKAFTCSSDSSWTAIIGDIRCVSKGKLFSVFYWRWKSFTISTSFLLMRHKNIG